MQLKKAIDNRWGTPFDLFNKIELVLGKFDLDAAAEKEWKMCDAFIDEDMDALNPKTEWSGNNIWINPPYDSKSLKRFVDRALKEIKLGKKITLLVPVKSEQSWFQSILKNGADLFFIEKRVKFRRRNGLPAINAQFPVVLIHLSSNITTINVRFLDTV